MSGILYSQGISQGISNQSKNNDCGCKSKNLNVPSPKTKAAMCQTCPHAERGTNGGAIGCTIDNKKIVDIVQSTTANCPVNRFAAGTNATQYFGLTFNGAPEPVRWLVTHAKGRNVDLDGCGCITALKGSTFGAYLEPWLEGISTLRHRYGYFLEEYNEFRRSLVG